MKKNKVKPQFYGGQAAMEGVMMRGKRSYALSVRGPNRQIKTVLRPVKTDKKYAFLKWPIFRGMASFVSSLYLGVRIIYDSADMSGLSDLEEETPSRFERWLTKRFGDKLFDYLMILSVALSLVLCVSLFILLPTVLSGLLDGVAGERQWIRPVTEGLLRLVIFVGYLLLVSRMKEIRRVFGYHGAEHKTINCYENGMELTTDNIRGQSRLHKRCGTSFLLIVMLVSMAVFFFVRVEGVWLRLLTRLAMVPFIAGLSYEIIMWAGRSNSRLAAMLSAPGIWLQKITTNEPDDGQIEVAAAALSAVLVDDGILKPEPAASPDMPLEP